MPSVFFHFVVLMLTQHCSKLCFLHFTDCDPMCYGNGQLAGGRAHNYFSCGTTPYPENIFKCAPTISEEV